MALTVYRARRVLTMTPEQPDLRDAGLAVQDGRIVALGPWKSVRDHGPLHDLGPTTLAPGLINAHTHLGLSHLAGRIPPGLGFAGWADRLFACLREKLPVVGLEQAVRLMAETGTVCVADVVGAAGERIRATLNDAGVEGLLLREVAGRLRGEALIPSPLPGAWSVAVHALYSASPELAQAAHNWAAQRGLPFSLHLAEVPGENELLLTGQGCLSDFLRQRRLLPPDFVAPGLSAVAYAQALGLLDSRTLAVHCVQVSDDDIELLAASGATACLCPQSNTWIGVGDPPVAALLAAGVPVCLGTDSLASTSSLNMWDELRRLRELAPALSARELLASVTVVPARVLGVDADFGVLAPGRPARWSVVPPDLLPEWE